MIKYKILWPIIGLIITTSWIPLLIIFSLSLLGRNPSLGIMIPIYIAETMWFSCLHLIPIVKEKSTYKIRRGHTLIHTDTYQVIECKDQIYMFRKNPLELWGLLGDWLEIREKHFPQEIKAKVAKEML